MKSFFLCLSVSLALVSAGKGQAGEHFPFLGEITRGPVNVRAGANANFEVVDKFNQGHEVVVLGKSYAWYKIQLPSTSAAYVRADYIKVVRGNMGEITGNKVNVRVKPNSNSSVLGQVSRGDLVKLSERVDAWWKIDPPFTIAGWVHADFIRRKSSQVPVQMVRRPLILEGALNPAITPPSTAQAAPMLLPITVQGRLQPSAEATMKDAHYEIMVGGKPVYYLQDAKGLERFVHTVVRVEGMVVQDSKLSRHPVMQVKKISLVL